MGLALHLATGAFWGAILGLIVPARWLRRTIGLRGGMVYGLSVMVVMAFVAVPVIASVLGGGEPISENAATGGVGNVRDRALVLRRGAQAVAGAQGIRSRTEACRGAARGMEYVSFDP